MTTFVRSYKTSTPKCLTLGLLCLLSLSLLSGCGDGRPTRVKISGKVSIDGKPVNTGGVQFYPTAGGRRGGGPLASGSYQAMMYAPGDGLPVGEYSVAIISNKQVNETTVRWFVPEKYADAKTSGLTLSVTEASDSEHFELTWEGTPHDGPYEVRQ